MFGLSWALTATLLMLLAIVIGFWHYERSRITSKEIALISTMAALAALGRVPFAVIPSLQPTTFLVIVTGYVFGGQAGFMVGAIAALVSNMFLGQGPWTPWQMLAWGLAGASGHLLRMVRPQIKTWELAVFTGAWGFLFGWIVNLWMWLAFVFPLTLQSLVITYGNAFWFDVIHATGNLAFSIALGGMFIKILTRFRNKLQVSYLPITYTEEMSKQDV